MVSSPNYLNFDLLITRFGDQYRAYVVDAPGGEADTIFELPCPPDEIGRLVLATGTRRSARRQQPDRKWQNLRDIGGRLFDAIFRDQVRSVFIASQTEAEGSDQALRIRLRFSDDAAELATLPWEILYDPQQKQFVALRESQPILRYLTLPRPKPALVVEPPLRVLAVLANPTDLAQLDVEAEWDAVESALAQLIEEEKVVLERLHPPTLKAFQKRLGGDDPIHVLHFVGHGVFDEVQREGKLVLENEEGNGHPIDGESLGLLLNNHPSLRLVYLNACEGAIADQADVFAGVAQTLVRYGAPAAVAMQDEISDTVAVELTRTFYAALATGRPVDAALTQARVALASASNEEWVIPVLFSRSPDNRLFDLVDVLPAPECPYPGMLHFTETESAFFYGRDQEIEEAVNHLALHPFLTIVGPSGSGKSSLVYAGIVPALRRSRRFRKGRWDVRIMRPGESHIEEGKAAPLAALATALGTTATDLKTVAFARPTLLIVDQFEEAFTLAEHAQAEEFLKSLTALIGRPNLYIVLTVRADFYPEILAAPELWQAVKPNRLELTPLGDDELWHAIVEPAAKVGVTVHDALAVALIADASEESGALPLMQQALVLLWEKVEKRELKLDSYREMADGQRTGLQVAIDMQADNVFHNKLPAEARPIARRIFLRLIQFGEGRSDTRRQQTVQELRSSGDDPALFDETLATLTEYRLLTASGAPDENENKQSGRSVRRVDIAHEALITGWGELSGWIADKRQAETIRRRLEDKAAEWVRLGSDVGGLMDEFELHEANEWLDNVTNNDLGSSERLLKLIDVSRRAIEERKQVENAARRRELEQERKLAEEQRKRAEEQQKLAEEQRNRAEERSTYADALRKRLYVLLALGTAATALAVLAFILANQSMRAEADARVAEAAADYQLRIAQLSQSESYLSNAKLIDDEEPVERVRLSALALPAAQGARPFLPAAELSLQQAMAESFERGYIAPGKGVHARAQVAVSKSRVAVGGEGLSIIGREELTPILVSALHESNVQGVAWNADGTLLSYDSHRLRTWQNNALKDTYEFSETVTYAEWLPFSTEILVCSGSELFSVSTAIDGKESIYRFEAPIRQFAISAAGHRVAAWDEDEHLVIWDLVSDQILLDDAETHGGKILEAAWSLSDQTLVTLSNDGRGMIRRFSDGEAHSPIAITISTPSEPMDTDLKSVGGQFVDEDHFVTWSFLDGTARLWSTMGEQLETLEPPSGFQIVRATLSPDSQVLAVQYLTGHVILWEMSTGKSVTLTGHTAQVLDLIWHEKGYLATAATDGSIRIWKLPDPIGGEQYAEMILNGHQPNQLSIRADVLGVDWQGDRELLSYGEDGTIRVWEVFDERGELLCHRNSNDKLDQPICYGMAHLVTTNEEFQSLRWIDDKTVAVVSDDGAVTQIFATDGQTTTIGIEAQRGRETKLSDDGAYALTFVTPAGDEGAAADDNAGPSVVDVDSGQTVYRFDREIEDAFWLDDLLLIDPVEGQLCLVSPATGGTCVELDGQTESIRDAHRIGNTLATTDHGTVRVWDVSTGKLRHPPIEHEKLGYDESVRINRDETLLAIGSLNVSVWNIGGEKAELLWTSEETMSELQGAPTLRFAADSDLLAIGLDKRLFLWDRNENSIVSEINDLTSNPTGMTWLDGADWYSDQRRPLLLTWYRDGNTYLWEATDRKLPRPAEADADGSGPALFAAARNFFAKNASSVTEEPVSYQLAQIALWRTGDRVVDAAFNSRGDLLATATSDGHVVLWETYLERPETLLEVATDQYLVRPSIQLELAENEYLAHRNNED